MFEKLNKMKEQVKEELKHIPRGSLEQNKIRMYYWPFRLVSLKGGKETKTKKQVLKECIDAVKRDAQEDFEPQYDKNFFR